MNWSLNVLVGLPIGIFIFLACAVVAIWMLRRARKEDRNDPYSDRFEWMTGFVISSVVGLITAIFTLLAFIPYDAQYHQWRPVTGTVQQIDSRMIADDKVMSQRFVVKIDGTLYGVDDTRASTLRPGDHVKLLCIRDWDWPSTDNGWVCKWDGQ